MHGDSQWGWEDRLPGLFGPYPLCLVTNLSVPGCRSSGGVAGWVRGVGCARGVWPAASERKETGLTEASGRI